MLAGIIVYVYYLLEIKVVFFLIVFIENVKLEQTGTDGNKTELTCKHHDRNDKAFNSTSTFWKKNDDDFEKYDDEFVKRQNEQTTLSIAAKDGDTFVCALKLKSGGMETSNLVRVNLALSSEGRTSEKSTLAYTHTYIHILYVCT